MSNKKLSACWRLMRISLLPTAWSNILMGFAVAAAGGDLSVHPAVALGVLLFCSSCLYLGGMVLNDVYDYELDCRERPERVLPQGLISVSRAMGLGYGLLLAALLVAALAGPVSGNSGFFRGSLLPVSVSLAVLILVYNRLAKATLAGPIVMGLCRTFNVLLGCSLAATSAAFDFSQAEWLVALSVGLYVAGITWFAKEEHQTSSRRFLLWGAAVMAAAIGLLMWFPFTAAFEQHVMMTGPSPASDRIRWLYCGLLALMVFPVAKKALVALVSRESGHVKQTVITGLLTIIVIDASLCYLVSPGSPGYALAVAALMIPAFLMTRRIMAT